MDKGGEAFKIKRIFGVAVGDTGNKLNKVAFGVRNLTDNFGTEIAVSGDRPVHVGNSDAGV